MPIKNLSLSALKSGLVALLTTLVCFVILYTPLPRQVGLAVRYDLIPTLPLLFILLYLILRIPGKTGFILAPILFGLIFALPISGLWASGTSEQYIMGGSIPFSDPQLYHTDALRLLNGSTFTQFSADKPIFPSFLATLLALCSYNLKNVLILLLLLPVFSSYLAARELQRTHGPAAASLFVCILFFFFRHLSGTTMTENLGFSLGLLAFVMFWRYAFDRKFAWLAGSLVLLSLALNARQGAFFVLPLLVLAVLWIYRRQRKQCLRYGALAVLTVASGFLINSFIFACVAQAGATSNSQFALHFYSLVTGGQYWNSLFTDHPELSNLPGNEYTRQGVQISLNHLSQHPEDLLTGIFKNYATYFSDEMRGEYSYIDGANTNWLNLVFRLGCFLFSAAGLVSLFTRRNRPVAGLLALCFIGMFISIPFVPPISTYKLRLMAATIWIEALLPALALTWILSKIPQKFTPFRPEKETQSAVWGTSGLVLFSGLLTAIIILGPGLIRLSARATPLPAANCPAGQKAVFMRVSPGSYLELVEHTDPRQGWLPYIRLAYFQLKIHNLADQTIFATFENIKEPTVLIHGIDLATQNKYLIFAPASQYSEKPGVVLACGNTRPDPPPYTEDYFFATRLTELNIP